MATVAEKLLTLEEYASLPDPGYPTELVRGRVVILSRAKFGHGLVCGSIIFFLRLYLREDDRGRAGCNDSGVITERNPDSLRGPDVAYYSYDRVPRSTPLDQYFDVAPEIAFEVLSPGDRRANVLAKVAEYLAAGVLVVCVLDAKRLRLQIYRSDDEDQILGADDELTIPDILPGFRVPVRKFFE